MESDHCFPQNCHSLSPSSLSASTNVVASAPQQQSEGLTNDMSSDDDLGHELSDSEHRGYRIVRILEPTHVQSDSSSLADHTHVEEAQAPATTQRDGAASRCQRSHSLASRFVRRLKASSAENPGNNKQGEPLVAKRRDSSQPCTEGLPDAAKSGDAGVIASDSDYHREALRLVRAFTSTNAAGYKEAVSGTETPVVDRYLPDLDYVPKPQEYKPSIFGALLTSKLNALEHECGIRRDIYRHHEGQTSRSSLTAKPPRHHKRVRSHDPSADNSGAATPKKIKWYDKPEHSALASMLVHSAMPMAGPGLPETSQAIPRPKVLSRHPSNEKISSQADLEKGLALRRTPVGSIGSQETLIAELRDIVACRRYLIKLCGAFMRFGAPTHRMEEYLSASARALAIDAEFLYIPGAMICTFIDNSMQANNVEVVRKSGGLDLGRLKDVFDVYKCVIHQKYTAEAGAEEIDQIIKRPDAQSELFRIFMFGLASVVVGPFSFSTRPIDFLPIFFLGCCLGFMQIKLVPRSDQFSNVFEVFACVLIAFISRGLGSIRWGNGQYVFCFSAVAQSSIAMILPGFLVLNSALELQSRNMVSGSVRMVYAIIYVLFLGFGLLVGTTIFGLMKRDAVTDVSCSIPEWWTPGLSYRLLYTRFIWAPLFAGCVAKIYKAKWHQLPVMVLIATAGHQANFWISTQLSSNLQVANAIGAFVIGCISNLYSRLFHGLAAAAMLPAIYCQVPGGLAASGSLVAGVNASSQIFGNSSSVSVINNGTAGFVQAQTDPNSVYGGTIFNVGYGMVQVAIGISVGLYLSALVVYPFGKRRSGLFSF